MKCAQIGPLLSACIDGEATVEEEKQAAEHIARCPSCAAFFKRMKTADALCSARHQVAPGASFEARLFERIRQQEAAVRPFLDFIGIEKKLLLAFGALLLVISALAYNTRVLTPSAAYEEMQNYVAGSAVQVASSNEVAAYLVEGTF